MTLTQSLWLIQVDPVVIAEVCPLLSVEKPLGDAQQKMKQNNKSHIQSWFHWALKAGYTFGNFYTPYTHSVFPKIMFKITNLWKFGPN